MALPIPRAAPVTSARRPSSLFIAAPKVFSTYWYLLETEYAPTLAQIKAKYVASRSPAGYPGSAQGDADGAVIAAQNLRVNRRAAHRAAQGGRHQKIVDSPPYVARPGVRKMTPPRIVAVSLREEPERIDEPRVHHILKSLALLVGESLFPAVRLGIGKIEFGVGNVQIAAKNDRLARLELLAIGKERRVPMLEAQIQPAEVALGIWRIHGDHVKVVEFRRDDPSFLGAVALQFVGKTEALRKLRRITVDDGDRLLLGTNGPSGTPLLDRRVA